MTGEGSTSMTERGIEVVPHEQEERATHHTPRILVQVVSLGTGISLSLERLD